MLTFVILQRSINLTLLLLKLNPGPCFVLVYYSICSNAGPKHCLLGCYSVCGKQVLSSKLCYSENFKYQSPQTYEGIQFVFLGYQRRHYEPCSLKNHFYHFFALDIFALPLLTCSHTFLAFPMQLKYGAAPTQWVLLSIWTKAKTVWLKALDAVSKERCASSMRERECWISTGGQDQK